MRVIVQGRLKARSYETREGEQRTVFEIDVEEVGPSLRSATAKVAKTSRSGGGQGFQSGGGDDPWASNQGSQGGGQSAPAGGQGGGSWGGNQVGGSGSSGGNQGGGQSDPWATPGGGSGSNEEPPF
jgi:single-strand DNA-binding protein